MRLLYLPGACSIGIRALLAEIGKPYEAEAVTRAGEPGHDAFTAINPKGKVPALIRDDGSLLTEFPAIAYYLARTNPELGLFPEDVEGAVQVLEMTEYLVATVHMQGYTRWRRPGKFAPGAADHPQVQRQGLAIYQAGLDRAEEMLAGRDWLFGRLTIADFALFYLEFWSVQNRAGRLGPRCRTHYDLLMARPRIAAAVAADAPEEVASVNIL